VERGDVEATGHRGGRARGVGLQQALRQLRDHAIEGDRFGASGEGGVDGAGQVPVQHHGAAHKRECARAAAEHLDGVEDPRGVHVQLAIAEPGVRAGLAIVRLIGVEHHHLTGQADFPRAAIGEGLDALGRQAHRVGVVTMRAVGRAAKPGLQEFDPVLRPATAQPVAGRPAARSFKTDAGGRPTLAWQDDDPPCAAGEKGWAR
jgi:hypothetical protein